MKFLIVDDDPAILKITSKFLELEGHEVVCVETALEALKKLSDLTYDILITDATMPAYSGFDLIRSIRKKDDLKDLTIAMLTGRSERSDIEQALELGVQDYIVKPINPEVFVAKMQNLVNRQRKVSKSKQQVSKAALHTHMQVPVSVTRITDIGISIESPCLLERGTLINLDIVALKEMGINSNEYKVIFSKPSDRNKTYLCELLLLNLDSYQKKQLETLAHRWLMQKVA